MTKALSIRLPDEMAAKLQRLAEEECRSLNQQVEYALKLYLAAVAEHPRLRVTLEQGR